MQPGTVVPSSSYGAYIVEGELGEGATSHVYVARIDQRDERVALKVLNPNLPIELESNFFLETDILRDLYAAEEGYDGKHAIPRLHEVQRTGNARFLVQELVRGVSLEDLLTHAPYYIEQEKDALSITAQVARVLHLLHTDLRRSYSDFQLKNIYWYADQRQVKVLDWNHVSDPNKGQPQDDLLLLGAHLYRMLVGKEAVPEQHHRNGAVRLLGLQGEPERMLERRAGLRWTEVSLGARRIVLQALHPNPVRRFPAAAALHKEVMWLEKMWTKEGIELATEVGQYLLHETEDSTSRAEILLDLAQRRGGVPAQALSDLDAKIAASAGAAMRPWQAGLSYYKSGDYPNAVKRWQAVVEERGRLDDFRWLQIARAGESNGPAFTSVKQQVEEVMRMMTEGNYAQAGERIRHIQLTAKLAPLDALLAEAEARVLMARAGQLEAEQAYEEATQCVEQAEAALSRIP